ncbi:golgin subfamily A member 6-like protein 22 [Aphidius gifuensis]|uniref:golgin subfamily A member 6-like protein 22 n=1 Tax=Aphidius gifuensis TaxID=684658 RepID=UPI001CDBBE43|nr:golgin subfamily A member 6-like protein 22 [Aphidius gifuensis]
MNAKRCKETEKLSRSSQIPDESKMDPNKLNVDKNNENGNGNINTYSLTLDSNCNSKILLLKLMFGKGMLEKTKTNVTPLVVKVQVCHPDLTDQKPQENLAKKSRPLSTERVRQYRARQREKKLQENHDARLASTCSPVSSTERSRQYRARQREKKLQENPDAILDLKPTTSSGTERSQQNQNPDERLIQNKTSTSYPTPLIVEAKVYNHDSDDEKLQENPAKKSRPLSTERVRQYRARQREKKLQENHDARLASTCSPVSSTERSRQYRARQREKKLQKNHDARLASTCSPVSSTERSRQYRARQREKKLQENPDAILDLKPTTSSSTERSQQYRNLDKRLIQNKTSTSYPTPLIVEAKVYNHDSDDEKLQENPAKKSRPLSTERVRQYRVRQREKKSQENPDAILDLTPTTPSSTERSQQYRSRKR